MRTTSTLAYSASAFCLLALLVLGATRLHARGANAPVDPSCTTSGMTACIEYDNNGSGPAVKGVGSAGNGIVGFTKADSLTPSSGKFGVDGEDISTNGGFNVGVNGFSGRHIGVAGGSNSGTGVEGQSKTGLGVLGVGSTGVGGSGQIAVLGNGSAIGVFGTSMTGSGVDASTESKPDGCNRCAAALRVDRVGGVEGPLIVANNSFNDVMSLDFAGNMVLRGTLTTNGTPLIAHTNTTSQRVGTYSITASEPVIEDFGEAQLTNGSAYVALASDFARIINSTSAYLVFMTPEGDTKGLYVERKSSVGFWVRESQGGRSSLVFDYRIVARPLSNHESRLPLMPSVLQQNGGTIEIPKLVR